MGPNNNVQNLDFVRTPFKRGQCGTVVALDVEMIYTTGGLEVAKVTLLDQHLNVLIREFVKPTNQILDYNTQFSGIKEEDIQGATKKLSDIHDLLLEYIHRWTIIVGHSLENDLKALRLIHHTVVDTAIVCEKDGYKPSLKKLSKLYLNKDVAREDKTATPLKVMQKIIENPVLLTATESSSVSPYV